MIAWKSLQLLLLCAPLAAWSNAQAQEAKPNGSQLQPVYSPANPKGGWKVKTQETRGAYSVLESVVQPSTGPEPHRHSREEEGFYILEGQYEFRVGTQVIKAGPGDFLFAPRNVPHTYKNVGTTPSRHLTIISPGGLESFFAERAAEGDTIISSRIPSKIQGSSGKVRARVQHGMAVLAAATIRHNFLLRRRTEVGG
jgi:quercetin dioxygenase-like cupin family protein